jgi:hypothetical protein
MLNLFRKKNTEKQYPHLDKVAAFFARNIIRSQTVVANWLSKYEQRMTISQKKIAFVLFCISMIILAGSFLYQGLSGNSSNSTSWFQQSSITIPETHPLPDSAVLNHISIHKDSVFIKTDTIHR